MAKFRKPFDKHNRVVKEIDPKTNMTHSYYRDECTPRNVVKRWAATGLNPHPPSSHPRQLDLSIIPEDYTESLNRLLAVEEAFEALPAKLRDTLGNDPRRFLEYIANPDNADEAEKYGLITINRPETPNKDVSESSAPDPKEGA